MSRLKPEAVAGPKPEGTRSLIIACGALVREIKDVLGANKLRHIDIAAVPALFHNRPERIEPFVRNLIQKSRVNYDHIFVAYGECGTQGELDKLLEAERIERLPGPHCYAFFSGVDTFTQHSTDDIGSFFLTDFLVRQFDSIVIKSLALDRHPELLGDYFGNYRKLVYLSQRPTEALISTASEAAKRLNLTFEHRPTGYGDLKVKLDEQFFGLSEAKNF